MNSFLNISKHPGGNFIVHRSGQLMAQFCCCSIRTTQLKPDSSPRCCLEMAVSPLTIAVTAILLQLAFHFIFLLSQEQCHYPQCRKVEDLIMRLFKTQKQTVVSSVSFTLYCGQIRCPSTSTPDGDFSMVTLSDHRDQSAHYRYYY